MKRILTLVVPAAALAVSLLALQGACNNVGDCPATSAIVPGGACKGTHLECPYTLQTPTPGCDGTNVDGGIATSCICTDDVWVCPAPVSCDTDAGTDAGDDGATDDGATDDGATDGAVDDSATDASGDASGDAKTD